MAGPTRATGPSIAGVDFTIRLSRATFRRSLENLWWAAGDNVLAIPLGAGAMQWAGITLSPAAGAILTSVSTIAVALNAQLLRRVDLRPDGSDVAVPGRPASSPSAHH